MAGAVKIAGLLLAAGAGVRFGGAKLLARIDGVPIARRALAALEAFGPVQTIIVVRPGADALRAALAAGPDALFVENPDADTGMASSLKAGLAALDDEVDAVFVALADMPQVKPATYQALAAAWDGEAAAVLPTYEGQRGNPVLLGRALFPELMHLTGDTGARPVLARYGDQVLEVAVDDPGVLADVDRPGDLGVVV